ncbi:MAG: cupin domain-containing protein [Desulfovibrio sp.]|nr:cupin domain-containing protein [Desulfovibrio sp.]
MITRTNALDVFDKELFGGPGYVTFTKIVDAQALAGNGRLFNIATLKPGHAIGYHEHKGELEIYYILEGEGTYNDNGVESIVKAGDVTVCQDGEGHGMINTGQADLKMVALILFTDRGK